MIVQVTYMVHCLPFYILPFRGYLNVVAQKVKGGDQIAPLHKLAQWRPRKRVLEEKWSHGKATHEQKDLQIEVDYIKHFKTDQQQQQQQHQFVYFPIKFKVSKQSNLILKRRMGGGGGFAHEKTVKRK